MSQWTHPICAVCFRDLYPGRQPHRLVEPEDEHCCVCGDPTKDGIYFREDPRMLPAHHEHDDA